MSLCLKNLTIRKNNGDTLFSGFTITVEKGEIVTLMGPSGCGKSTLLDAIAGHLSNEFHYSGSVTLNDATLDRLPAHKRKVGILFQDDMLFPHLTIWENLAFALPNAIKGNTRKESAMQALKNISLIKIANSFPDQVSGGQRARIALTRMLLAQPKAALLDEPFSKLDKDLRVQFRNWVVEQLQQANIPTIMVTHDEDDIPEGSRCITWPWETENA
ncbi:ATP-binding cassette domain-containing protein [Vibrio natriegens]|uniref:ABC transporter ATP-binding protein n=1 Tax=Vibrio natriegens NBRC 15636 = ATCC 14048 = DSM 759 TaxID=1219067 RepID=A0AAN1CW70_VIBNA|nr:ATP-binding cassette domain-containing protein [Vibrio natriegens]ALR15851.1 ABC transporter ATP-binding protein [Vibrio natriegens NBRC 15636 = ATCC 14048 = DSM 759]ANQ12290.1 ABC transporter ATP-binding protein [Vibrio natriegens NBRC 15636 = ATCC 14048 = DSM 759]EPM42775.1 ABC transporter ATP-binding protein [Vibrio natriegens NBRC 15636 = ATCC 14048 = DSM 759]MDX6026666.1 ATP-binding cassette domain-containing protein [Vibrio natriegens NBRC 15636 = ATCC 14048 = DSM 759]UUI12753.1 ATP-b